MVVALRLSKSGYGRPDEILDMRCDLVMAATEYEGFLMQYESTMIEMNREGK